MALSSPMCWTLPAMADGQRLAWSPDGNWVAYRANVGQVRQIEKAPSGGGPPGFGVPGRGRSDCLGR